MLYLGLDVHGKWTTVRGFDPDTGELVEADRMPNTREGIRGVLGGLEKPLLGIMESGTNSWAMYRELLPFFERLVVADPLELWDRKRDRKAKTDRKDAMRMADKLYRGEVTPLYIPDERTQDLRVLVRGKIRASRLVTKLTNEIGSLLRSWGYVGERSLLSKSGKADLAKAELPELSAQVLELYKELLEKTQEFEDKLAKMVEEEAEKDEKAKILQTMPNVGPFSALLYRAEVGDVERFHGDKSLISYVGLSPRTFQSGEQSYHGRLGNWGNRWLKYGLCLLANRIAASREDNPLRQVYWRVLFKNDRNSAKIAVARKATRIIYHLLKTGEPWEASKHREGKAA